MARDQDSLKNYRSKRDFKKTTEPEGEKRKEKSKKPIFVIQKHDASSLHYDFRIEVNGVLKSWAVPKGPSTNPKDKRLAIMTEDHPMEYAKFEGIIPEGEYGAGPVIIWDRGTYRNIKKEDKERVPMKKCFRDGQIEIFLYGKKLKGGYALVRMKDQKNWLLIKMKDEHADARRKPTSTQPKSVKSGKTIKDVRKTHEKKKVLGERGKEENKKENA